MLLSIVGRERGAYILPKFKGLLDGGAQLSTHFVKKSCA